MLVLCGAPAALRAEEPPRIALLIGPGALCAAASRHARICRPHPRQGSTTGMPIPSKSATLRVASVIPRARAMAAICASNALIGLPVRRRSATISANSPAAALSKARILPINKAKICRAAVERSCLRLPSGRIATPSRISVWVMAVVKRSSAFCRAIQAATAGSGLRPHRLGDDIRVEDDHRRLAEFGRLADRLARRNIQLVAAKRLDDAPDRRVKIARTKIAALLAERLTQDVSRLALQALAAPRRPRRKARFQRVIDIGNGDAGQGGGSPGFKALI